MHRTRISKRYSVVVPGTTPVVIRQTTTVNHAIKHAAYASELRISVRVVENATQVVIIEVPAIDKAHKIKPSCKRDKRYARLAKQAKGKGQ